MRTITFTMEDALISPEGFMILSGAGLIEASDSEVIYQHVTERIDRNKLTEENLTNKTIPLTKKPYLAYQQGANGSDGNYAYVMLIKDDEIISEPYIPFQETTDTEVTSGAYSFQVSSHDNYDSATDGEQYDLDDWTQLDFDSILVDYYTPRTSNAKQIEITADQFGGNYYLEASTLFRTQNGVDMPAEFIIPNCKIQSNFTFTMASSGDPSTFTFTMDAFPDYTRFDRSKKVLAAIQIIEDNEEEAGGYRKYTPASGNSAVTESY